MATLSGFNIIDSSKHSFGLAVLLSSISKVNEIFPFPPNGQIEIQANNPYIIAKLNSKHNMNDTLIEGHDLILKGLDILCASGKGDLSIRNMKEIISWWKEGRDQVLRWTIYEMLGFSIGPVKVEIKDNNGNVIPPPKQPKIIYHECMRYFRLSQITDDVFEAFRNLYLAFELILNFIEPKQIERERIWLKRALNTANSKHQLVRVFEPITGNVVSDIINEIYTDIRCAVFHAKKSYLIPQNLADKEKVQKGFIKLSNLVVFLMEKYLNTRNLTGGMTYFAFSNFTQALFSKSELIFSDSSNNSVNVSKKYAPELSSDGLSFILGSIDGPNIKKINDLKGFILRDSNKNLFTGEIEGVLSLEHIDRLEIQIGLQLNNLNQPKYLFTL